LHADFSGELSQISH